MNTTFVDDVVNRSNRNLLIISLLALVILIGAEVATFRYFYNFFRGPQPIDAETLLTIEDPEALQQYYVTVEDMDAYDTGFQYVTENNGNESIDQSYLLLDLNERWLLTRVSGELADPDNLESTYTGGLIPISDEIQREVVDVIYEDEPDLEGIFLPYMLDATDFRTPGYLGLIVAAVVLVLSLAGLFTTLRRMSNPASHPAVKSLSRFGDPNTVAQQIELEMASEHPQVGNLHFTRNWMVHKQSASMEAMRYRDVVWAYKRVTQLRTYGIPTGKTFNIHIFDRFGKSITPSAKELQVDEALSGIAQRAPWAFIGYDGELEKAWKKQREQVISVIDQRIQEVTAAR
jgi:hypothetical protein